MIQSLQADKTKYLEDCKSFYIKNVQFLFFSKYHSPNYFKNIDYELHTTTKDNFESWGIRHKDSKGTCVFDIYLNFVCKLFASMYSIYHDNETTREMHLIPWNLTSYAIINCKKRKFRYLIINNNRKFAVATVCIAVESSSRNGFAIKYISPYKPWRLDIDGLF